MFVANLASINQYQTTEDYNVDFPDPNKYVEKMIPLNYPFKTLVGSGYEIGLNFSYTTSPGIQTSISPEYSNFSVLFISAQCSQQIKQIKSELQFDLI